MVYFNSVIIYPSFLTEREVEEIHIHSKGIELQDAGVGGEVLNDPDAAALSSQGNIRHNIRQSDVKWMNHQVMPQDIRKKIEDTQRHRRRSSDYIFSLSSRPALGLAWAMCVCTTRAMAICMTQAMLAPAFS